MLITERVGRLRIVRDFVLDPEPISGIPSVLMNRYQGLWDVALHPRFAENRLVYFTYSKQNPDERLPAGSSDASGTPVLARGRFDGGHALTDVQDIFVSNGWNSSAAAARIVFGRDGKIYMATGVPLRDREHGGNQRVGTAESAQDPGSHLGKVLRLNDDGTVPSDNPFVGKPGYKPEIYGAGLSQSAWSDHPPGDGRSLGCRARPAGRRRSQYHQAGPELRLARHLVWPLLPWGRHPGRLRAGAGRTMRTWHGAAAHRLGYRQLPLEAWSITRGTNFRSGREVCLLADSEVRSCTVSS